MRRLTVKNFSCIDQATLDLGQLTVLIGPQASGKSVLSKLSYFFYTLLDDQFELIQDGENFAAFRKHVRTKFIDWFPPSAWGSGEFSIEFLSGELEVRLKRGSKSRAGNDAIRMGISPFFEEQYTTTFDAFHKSISRLKEKAGVDTFDAFYKARSSATANLSKRLGDDYVQSKLFIPAGRSFFTSVGRAVVAFEQGRILDPATLNFGRFIAAVRDRGIFNWSGRARKFLGQDAVRELFGGEIRIDRQKEYLETLDGRRVPFSALSSGQQELLPLLFALEFWTGQGSKNTLLYIEEPEAHLFPSAQSALVEILAGLVSAKRGGVDLVVTTHSPYVLAKLNNLIKASQLAEMLGSDHQSKIEAVIPKKAWLQQDAVRAYAIENRLLKPVNDSEGLINADYLDSVSDCIAQEFSSLLELEVKYGASRLPRGDDSLTDKTGRE